MNYDDWRTNAPDWTIVYCEVCGQREADLTREVEFLDGECPMVRKIEVCVWCAKLSDKDLLAGVRDGDEPTAPAPFSPVTTEHGSDANAVQGATDQKQSAA